MMVREIMRPTARSINLTADATHIEHGWFKDHRAEQLHADRRQHRHGGEHGVYGDGGIGNCQW